MYYCNVWEMMTRGHFVIILVMLLTSFIWSCKPSYPVCAAIPTRHLDAANNVWNFLRINDKLQKSDIILGLGSHDRRVAMEAARLWLAGWADILVYSGCSGNLTSGKWSKSEAEVFKDIVVSMGVPPMKVLLETKSKNTGENVRYTHELLSSSQVITQKLILVQTPHMGRRTIATFLRQWPNQQRLARSDVTVRTLDIPLFRYPNDDVGDLDHVIAIMLGYFQRLYVYHKRGYQTYTYIPKHFQISYELLVKSNRYNSYLTV